MWKLEEKQVGQVIEKYSLFRTLLLGSGERLKVFFFFPQSFILKKKSEEKGKKESWEGRTMLWEYITTWSDVLFDIRHIQVSVRKMYHYKTLMKTKSSGSAGS